jgi:hypothetical protein
MFDAPNGDGRLIQALKTIEGQSDEQTRVQKLYSLAKCMGLVVKNDVSQRS